MGKVNNPSIHPATFRERLYPFVCGFIFFVPAIIMTLVGGGIGIEFLTDQWRLTHWVRIPAIIEESQCLQQSGVKYKAFIRYRYNFSGKEFHSKRLNSFNSYMVLDAAQANDFIGKYAIGSATTAYVDPTHPRRAVLNISKSNWWMVCLSFVFFLTGSVLIVYTIYLMWRSITAFCIIRASGSSGNGTRFYFFDSLELAQKASEVKFSPKEPARFNERIAPLLGGLLFATIGIAGLIVLIKFDLSHFLILRIVGFIIMPVFIIMGTGIMYSAASARYIVHRRGPYGQEEVSFLDSQDIPPPQL